MPTLDPAGELLLDFYNEYVGNALLMAREAQNQKSQLAIQEAQSNPFGLTAQDQLEIEKLRANPFGLTANQRDNQFAKFSPSLEGVLKPRP